MDIAHKFFAIIGDMMKKGGVVAIKTVEIYPFEPNTISSRSASCPWSILQVNRAGNLLVERNSLGRV